VLKCRTGELDLGAERRHCCVRERVVDALVESWHCTAKDCELVFLRDRENVESNDRLGTTVFGMIAVVKVEAWSMS
jgi:hypothetical protein